MRCGPRRSIAGHESAPGASPRSCSVCASTPAVEKNSAASSTAGRGDGAVLEQQEEVPPDLPAHVQLQRVVDERHRHHEQPEVDGEDRARPAAGPGERPEDRGRQHQQHRVGVDEQQQQRDDHEEQVRDEDRGARVRGDASLEAPLDGDGVGVGEQHEGDEDDDAQVARRVGEARVRRDHRVGAVRQQADEVGEVDDGDEHEPRGEVEAGADEGGAQADAASAAVREEVDGDGDERQEQGGEDGGERAARQRRLVREEDGAAARRAGRRGAVDGHHHVLHGRAHLGQRLLRHRVERVVARRGPTGRRRRR